MKPLKVGDKVAAYSGAFRYSGVFRKVGVVVESLVVRNREMVRVNIGTESKPDLFFYHRKQLRRIKKKDKALRAAEENLRLIAIERAKGKPATRQPRRVWVNYYNNGAIICHYNKTEAETYRLSRFTGFTECVEFVEVMKEGGE